MGYLEYLLETFWKGPNRSRNLTFAVGTLASVIAARKILNEGKAVTRQRETEENENRSREEQPVVRDLSPRTSFWTQLRQLRPHLIPSLFSRQSIYLVLLSLLLIARTGLSIYLAEIVGRAVEFLVEKRWMDARENIHKFILASIPASLTNSALHYYTTALSLAMRVELSQHVHDRYLQGVAFYNIVNLPASNFKTIDNVDQRITVDIKRFSDEIAEIFTHTLKPALDIILFTWKLAEITGWHGPGILYGYFGLTFFLKRFLMPSLGKLAKTESKLDGDYRAAHVRLITNSEEVAFYDGSSREKSIINRKLDEVKYHTILFAKNRAIVSVLDNLLVKYYATVAGYMVQFAPILFSGLAMSKTTAEMSRDYARLNRYIGLLADAIGQIVIQYGNINELSGHTSRVSILLERISSMEAKMEPFEVVPDQVVQVTVSDHTEFLKEWRERMDKRALERSQNRRTESKTVGNVLIEEGDNIEFSNIDVVSPEGKLLVKNLNLNVKGINVMVTGPNGAGKSSLFRILGELWPPAGPKGARLVKPRKEDILFIPQKPYLVLGTLRDQIIYPHDKEQMKQRGVTDKDLEKFLDIVDPGGIIKRNWHNPKNPSEVNWDVVQDWFVAFSGGQKQRIAMCRLFYHRPRFAILDECTSAVSDEVEDTIYNTCKKLGICLFTVSHRKYLRKHHDFELTFTGLRGEYTWKNLGDHK